MPSGGLAALEPLTAALRQRTGVVGIAVVGSFARDEVRPGSDLDVVVLTDPETSRRVEVFEYADHLAEVLFIPESAIRAALDNPRGGAQMIATWAGGRVLHDTDDRLSTLLAEIETLYRQGPADMTQEEREYARFELAHLWGLIEETASSPTRTGRATCRLLIAPAVRAVTDSLLRHARRWPVGWRATLPALRSLDARAADLAARALTEEDASAVDAARALIDHARHTLGEPLRPGP